MRIPSLTSFFPCAFLSKGIMAAQAALIPYPLSLIPYPLSLIPSFKTKDTKFIQPLYPFFVGIKDKSLSTLEG